MVTWHKIGKSPQVFLTLGAVWMVIGIGYDDYTLKILGAIFLLSGLIALVKELQA